MKKNLLLLFLLVISINLYGQSKFEANNDLFGQRVFVKNNGQFNSILSQERKVEYAYNNEGEQVYFSKTGVTYLLQKRNPITHSQKEALEHGKKVKIKPIKKAFVEVTWENSNPNVEIVVGDKQSHYMSYGDEQLKSECFKKITYKNIYNNIDLEYVFTDERTDGIKYTFLVHPGGNIDNIKCKYSGDVDKVILKGGNIIIKTPIRNIKELAPVSYQDGVSVVSNFKVVENTISFLLPNSYDKTKDLSIDPWVINLALESNNYGFDVDYDYFGNYYVYGGSGPFKTSKYTSSGTLLWTFMGTVPSINWDSIGVFYEPGNFIVDKVSGKVYIGIGVVIDGTRIIRLNTLGIYDNLVSTQNATWQEVWDMGYRCSDGGIFGLGGSTSYFTTAGILDTTTGAIEPQSFSGLTTDRQDALSHAIDPNGDIFLIYASFDVGTPFLSNKILKINATFDGNDWIAPSMYGSFSEYQNKQYPDLELYSNGFNALNANSDYLYYYDGLNLAAYDKSTGVRIGFTELTGQFSRAQGGIAVDECNNVYVGGVGFVQCFSFDGTTFTSSGSIPVASTTLTKNVTDIKLNESTNELYVSGSGFGGVYAAINSGACLSDASISIVQTQIAINNSTVQATVATSVVAPLVSYTWLDSNSIVVSQTNNSTELTNTVTNLPNGSYTVVAQLNAPCGITSSQTFVLNATTITPVFTQVSAICSGGSLALLPIFSNNGITGSWAPALDNAETTTYTFTPNSGQNATVVTMTITVNEVVAPLFAQVLPICSGGLLSDLPTTSNNEITGTWIPAMNNTQTTVYNFTPEVGQCAMPAQMTIQVNLPIAPTFTQVPAICTGGILSTLPTTSTNEITGIWSPAINNLETTLYTFAPATGQCATAAQMTIAVALIQAATFTQVSPVCLGTFLPNLPTTSINSFTGNWSPTIDSTQTTLYTFTPALGQCATSAQMTIVVNDVVTSTFTQVSPICSGTFLADLPVTSTNAVAGAWAPAINNLQTTLYTFTPTLGQCATTAQMTIIVNDNVTPTFAPVSPICTATFLSNLPTTSENAIVGSWSPPIDNLQTTLYTFTPTVGQCARVAQTTIVVNPLQLPVFTPVVPICAGELLANLPVASNNLLTGTWAPAMDNSQSTTYDFVPDAGQCATTVQMTIVVNPIRVATFNQIPSICFQELAPILPATDSNGLVGTWQPSIVSNISSGNYVFTPAIGQCSFSNFVMPITIFDDFDFEIKQACVGTDFVLQIVPLASSFDINEANFTWRNSASLSVGLNNPTFNVTNYFKSNSILPQFPLSFSVEVALPNGCSKTREIPLVSIYCSIQKGISPNNDNKNEFFDLQLLNVRKLEIFNRYGTKVYSKENYIKEWVGQCDDGGILPDGVYYYVIDFYDDQSTKVGWIYLTR